MEAMQSQTVDVVKRMKEISLVLQIPEDVLGVQGVTSADIEDLLDELQEHVESIDMANEHDGDDGMWFDEESPCSDSKVELIKGVDLDREWWRRHDQFHNVGYRDGLTSGKEASAQEGFTIGFKQSVLVGYKFGTVRGVSSALAFLSNDLKEKLVQTPETREKLQLLHKSVHSVSRNDALKLFHDEILASKPKEHSLAEGNSSVKIMPDAISSCSQLESYSLELESLLQSSAIQVHSVVE